MSDKKRCLTRKGKEALKWSSYESVEEEEGTVGNNISTLTPDIIAFPL